MNSNLTLAEQLLVIQAQRGDGIAFRQLIELYEQRLWFYCRRLTGDDHRAWDVVQEVWLHTFQKLHTLQAPAAFRVWLYQIAHHRAVSLVRREVRREAIIDLHESDAAVTSVDEFLQLEQVEAIHYALDALTDEHREVLTLMFLEDMSIDEMAEVLKTPPGTVKSRLYHAKRNLRDRLEGNS